MTVKELIRELKQYPQDAIVYVNNDWDAMDDGHFTNITEVQGTCDDVAVIDIGMDFVDEHRILIEAY